MDRRGSFCGVRSFGAQDSIVASLIKNVPSIVRALSLMSVHDIGQVVIRTASTRSQAVPSQAPRIVLRDETSSGIIATQPSQLVSHVCVTVQANFSPKI